MVQKTDTAEWAAGKLDGQEFRKEWLCKEYSGLLSLTALGVQQDLRIELGSRRNWFHLHS